MSPANLPEELVQEQQENQNAKVIPLHEQAEVVMEEGSLNVTNPERVAPSPERIAQFDEMAGNSNKKEIISYGNYIIRDSNVYLKCNKEGEEEKKEIFICKGILPIAYLRDPEGKNHALLLEVNNGERKHLWAMPRRTIAKPQEVIDNLLDLGLDPPLDQNRQKILMEFFKIAKPKEKMRCVDKSGWHGSQFIFPDGKVYGESEDNEGVYPVSEVSPKGVKAKGSLEEWQENVAKKCVGNSRLILCLGMAFAAPCLELLGEDSGGVNLKGPSSIGKTKCLNVAVSVYGSPEFKRSWKTTANGLESICALYNDCLLPLDEFGQADAKEAGEISYMISQGIGKQRAARDGSARDPKTWRILLCSTGEVGLEEHMRTSNKKTMAGQMARVADVPAEPIDAKYRCFEEIHGCSDGAEFADDLGRACREYYGTAGPAFIESLLAYGKEKARTDLKYIVENFVADNAMHCDGQVKRVARRFGIVYAALSLAIKFKVIDLQDEQVKKGIEKCFKDWLRDRGTTGDIESHSIIEQVKGLLFENSDSKFIAFSRGHYSNSKKSTSKEKMIREDKRIRAELWGYKEEEQPVFYLTTRAFTHHISKGYDHKLVAKVLASAGLLEGAGGKSSKLVRIPGHDKQPDRFYVINLNVNELDNKEGVESDV